MPVIFTRRQRNRGERPSSRHDEDRPPDRNTRAQGPAGATSRGEPSSRSPPALRAMRELADSTPGPRRRPARPPARPWVLAPVLAQSQPAVAARPKDPPFGGAVRARSRRARALHEPRRVPPGSAGEKNAGRAILTSGRA